MILPGVTSSRGLGFSVILPGPPDDDRGAVFGRGRRNATGWEPGAQEDSWYDEPSQDASRRAGRSADRAEEDRPGQAPRRGQDDVAAEVLPPGVVGAGRGAAAGGGRSCERRVPGREGRADRVGRAAGGDPGRD